jgi:hypothetical protein
MMGQFGRECLASKEQVRVVDAEGCQPLERRRHVGVFVQAGPRGSWALFAQHDEQFVDALRSVKLVEQVLHFAGFAGRGPSLGVEAQLKT